MRELFIALNSSNNFHQLVFTHVQIKYAVFSTLDKWYLTYLGWKGACVLLSSYFVPDLIMFDRHFKIGLKTSVSVFFSFSLFFLTRIRRIYGNADINVSICWCSHTHIEQNLLQINLHVAPFLSDQNIWHSFGHRFH